MRINTWAFELPGLAGRREDIEPNLEFELDQFAAGTGRQVTMNKEARMKFLQFAMYSDAPWRGNFRDLNAAVTRMATLAPRGRIREEEVQTERGRLERAWHREEDNTYKQLLKEMLGQDRFEEMDPFDVVQVAYVVEVCRESKTISEAGRKLFAVSRVQKKSSNDSDRLRKYLVKFGLEFGGLGGQLIYSD